MRLRCWEHQIQRTNSSNWRIHSNLLSEFTSMASEPKNAISAETIEIDLRSPAIAGVIAWLVPGGGHLYQRRYAKGVLFMVCILGTYFFGLSLADGHVVYASLTKEDFRWQYACQLGVGASALPALVQNQLVRRNQAPLFGGVMAPPRN